MANHIWSFFSVDATDPETSGLGRYSNDEWISPNCKMVKLVVDRMPGLFLKALVNIKPNTEITYDYGVDNPWRHVQQ